MVWNVNSRLYGKIYFQRHKDIWLQIHIMIHIRSLIPAHICRCVPVYFLQDKSPFMYVTASIIIRKITKWRICGHQHRPCCIHLKTHENIMYFLSLTPGYSLVQGCDEIGRCSLLKSQNIPGNNIRIITFDAVQITTDLFNGANKEAKESHGGIMNPFGDFILETEITWYMPQLYKRLH